WYNGDEGKAEARKGVSVTIDKEYNADGQEIVSVATAANMLRISPTQVYRLIAQGDLNAFEVTAGRRLLVSEVAHVLATRNPGTRPLERMTVQ
ncbi:MAG: helix-turn-helix domain-containing protein, partial [Nitrospinae bacterium]|nr:helix-turn-helix domain-containing protein [Nitrospinota bacterium]